MFAGLLFFSNLLILLFSGNIQTDFFCIRNVQNSSFVFEGTYQFWNTSNNGQRVWQQTSNGEINQLFLGNNNQCTDTNIQQQIMTQYSAIKCWCLDNIGINGNECAYFAPTNDTNIAPNKVFHGWFNNINGNLQDINISSGRCGSDVPTITTQYFCATGTPESNGYDFDGTFYITEQEKNGEYVWYRPRKEIGGGFSSQLHLFVGLNNSQCALKAQYPSLHSIQNSYSYCWCIDSSYPTVGSSCATLFAPISSKNTLPSEVPIGWYNRTGNKWETYQLIEGEECNKVNRLHYSVFIALLCHLIIVGLQ